MVVLKVGDTFKIALVIADSLAQNIDVRFDRPIIAYCFIRESGVHRREELENLSSLLKDTSRETSLQIYRFKQGNTFIKIWFSQKSILTSIALPFLNAQNQHALITKAEVKAAEIYVISNLTPLRPEIQELNNHCSQTELFLQPDLPDPSKCNDPIEAIILKKIQVVSSFVFNILPQ